MNLAARLQSSAPPGGILISQDTYRCVRGVFDVSPQPMLAVKGKREPVQTFLVLRAKQRAFRTAMHGPAGIAARIIGRDQELAQLQKDYLAAFETRRLAWSQITGEPGMGKSRLVDEMIDFLELRLEQFRLFRGRAYEGETRQPFALLRRLWFDRFQIAEDAPLSQAEARWIEEYLKLGGDAPEMQIEAAQVVGRLVGLPFSGSPTLAALQSDPAQLKERAFVASQRLLNAVRRTGPVVFLLEDLHWADGSSWEYLTQVVLAEQAQESQGLFVLATARPEWAPPDALTRHLGYRQIDLHSLSGEATLELARALMQRVEAVPDQVLRTIAERAEGVPYFVEEMVHWLLDHGVIEAHQEPWRFLPERMEQFRFPPSLQHLLLARLNVLERGQRAALQRGAVYGRNFWAGGLAALGVEGGESLLRQLQPRGLIDYQPESSFEGDSEWSFHHNLLREVTYDSILKRERASLHRAAAAWLEAQARQAERLDEFAGLLGTHTELGGEPHTAAHWFARAGERARSQGALREALNFFERALGLFPPEDREQRWQALFRRCSLMGDLAQVDGRREALQALLELSRETGDPVQLAEANSLTGFFLTNRGEDRPALFVYEAGLAAARQAGDRSIEARLLAQKVVSLTRLGEFQAAAPAVEEALACAREVTDEETLARIYTNLALFFTESGDLARAAQMIAQAAELSRGPSYRPGEVINLSNLGYTYVLLGMAERSLPALQRAIELAESVGARRLGGYASLNLALAHFRLGSLPAAQKILNALLPNFEALKDAFAQASAHAYLALSLEAGGEPELASRRFNEALEILRFIEAPGYASDARAGLARCALALGRLEEAGQFAGQVWDTLLKQGPEGMEFPVWAYLTCAEVFEARGETGRSRAAVEAGYQELSTRAGKISDPEWRQSFLENIPEHREMTRWASGQARTGTRP
jgi:predicted ATPase